MTLNGVMFSSSMEKLINQLKKGEVKPEFGNVEHIKAVKYINALAEEEKEREEDRKTGKLKKYRVTLYYNCSVEKEVEAYSEKEAKEIVDSDICNYDLDVDELADWAIDEM